MINLWFRFKTSTSCRTLIYPRSSGRATLGRPEASGAPWRLQFKHLTTLFYSSIIATAAAADVQAKRARREQWISAIAEAERFLQEVKDRTEVPISGSQPLQDNARDAELHELDSGIVKSFDDICTNTQLEELAGDIRTGLGRAQGLYGHKTSLSQIQEKARVAPQSMYASESRRLSRPENWVPKKLLSVELAVSKLTTRLLLEVAEVEVAEVDRVRPGQFERSAGKTGAALHADSLRRRLDKICTALKDITETDAQNTNGVEGVDYPKYKPDINGFQEAQIELNRAMLTLFRNYAAGQYTLSDLLSKISYNLLVSQAPPSLGTWTLLISCFSRLQQYHLVDMVLEAIDEAHIRPNEMTVSATLAHHVRKKDFDGFHRYVGKLQGFRGGLMLARGDINIGAGASRLHHRGNKIIQSVTFDAHIYYNVTAGYLKFRDLSAAIIWYRRMLQDGFKADLQLLIQFLRYFLIIHDWERGFGMWKTISRQHLNHQSSSIDFNYREEVQSAYYFMLQLCRICQKSQDFRTIYDEGLRKGFTMTMLLVGESINRGFSLEDNLAERLSRNVRKLEHRALLSSQDLRKWFMQTLASKIILRRFDLNAVQTAFERHADGRAYDEWLAERPWLQNVKGMIRPFPLAERQRGEDGMYASSRTYSFNQDGTNVSVKDDSSNDNETHMYRGAHETYRTEQHSSAPT